MRRRLRRGALRMVSERTRLARIGKATDGSAEAATRAKLAKTSSVTTRVEITRAAIGKRKAAAAAAAGGVVGIARTGVTAVVAAILNATTSR